MTFAIAEENGSLSEIKLECFAVKNVGFSMPEIHCGENSQFQHVWNLLQLK
jgi:hypothetical protein